jgi:NADPH:quinone reductase
LAGVCWATSRICWLNGPGPSSIFGSLGGETNDIRLFPPHSLTLKGVVLGSQPPEQRKSDIALAQRLAHEPETLFEVAERYSPPRIADAVAHVSQAGRTGVVLIDFSND